MVVRRLLYTLSCAILPVVLLVLPFSSTDWGLAQQLLTYMRDLGPYAKHQCLVTHPQNAKEFAPGVVTEAQRCGFSSVDVFETPHHKDGWPFGPNYQFLNAANEVFNNPKYTGPWYFMEADNTPQHAGWLDRIQDEYVEGRKPFMGAVVPTRMRMGGGAEVAVGEHLVGTAIYPKLLARSSQLFSTIKYQKIPWDLYLQHEIMPQCTPTRSIQHIWNVQSARRRGDAVLCSPNNPISQPVPVRADALVVHGFKDGSLMKLRQEERV
jgi:hypothetical protein